MAQNNTTTETNHNKGGIFCRDISAFEEENQNAEEEGRLPRELDQSEMEMLGQKIITSKHCIHRYHLSSSSTVKNIKVIKNLLQ